MFGKTLSIYKIEKTGKIIVVKIRPLYIRHCGKIRTEGSLFIIPLIFKLDNDDGCIVLKKYINNFFL